MTRTRGLISWASKGAGKMLYKITCPKREPHEDDRLNLIYLDEQHGSHEARRFTAVHGVIVGAGKILQVREKFFKDYRGLLTAEASDSKLATTDQLPVVHGSQLLEGFDDDTKLAVVNRLFFHFTDLGGVFLRVGYYHDSIDVFARTEEERTRFCVINILLALRNYFQEPYIIVHEMDREGLKRVFRFESDDLSRYYGVAESWGWDNISVDYRNMVGHHIAPKTDLGCQMADMVGFVAYKAEVSSSAFVQRLSDIYRRYSRNFIINTLIEMKEVHQRSS